MKVKESQTQLQVLAKPLVGHRDEVVVGGVDVSRVNKGMGRIRMWYN